MINKDKIKNATIKIKAKVKSLAKLEQVIDIAKTSDVSIEADLKIKKYYEYETPSETARAVNDAQVLVNRLGKAGIKPEVE